MRPTLDPHSAAASPKNEWAISAVQRVTSKSTAQIPLACSQLAAGWRALLSPSNWRRTCLCLPERSHKDRARSPKYARRAR